MCSIFSAEIDVEQAQITEGAKLGSNGMLTYPGDVGKLS